MQGPALAPTVLCPFGQNASGPDARGGSRASYTEVNESSGQIAPRVGVLCPDDPRQAYQK